VSGGSERGPSGLAGRELLTEAERAEIKYDASGLVPAIVQERSTGEVLMMAWMNEDTLERTLTEGRTVFWSRSRQEQWRKGDTSGERQWVRGAYYDCDGDVLLFVVDQDGQGACHTGNHSCFFRPLTGATLDAQAE
jgi:phosphoribosyl-AMP cyclohydrolase/phosphoribosyl-ATP pyrophosphohydrolase/phosphoribosyl-AMP cyclohydrolase